MFNSNQSTKSFRGVKATGYPTCPELCYTTNYVQTHVFPSGVKYMLSAPPGELSPLSIQARDWMSNYYAIYPEPELGLCPTGCVVDTVNQSFVPTPFRDPVSKEMYLLVKNTN